MVFVLDFHALFSLNGLVHTFVVAAAFQDATGEVIDDKDFTFAHNIVFVLGE